MKACLCAIVCMHVMWAQGSRLLPPTLNRHVTFVIEGDWSAGMDLGSADYCSSGGLNHAKHLLSAFWSVSFALMPNRQPLMLRPRYIFAQGHGAIPENVKWQDLFDWEPYNVDSDEFKSPDDLWSAIKSNPGRFEVFDIFQNHGTLIDRVRRSEAEIAVIHMYGRNNSKPRIRCTSFTPFQQLLSSEQRHGQHIGFNVSMRIRNAASIVAREVFRRTNSSQFATVHVRRGDALQNGVLGGGGYMGHDLFQMMVVTDPQFVLRVLQQQPWTLPVLLFSNEPNVEIFNVIKGTLENVFFEEDVVGMLPNDTSVWFADSYSRFLLCSEVARKGVVHLCTAESKLGVKCDVRLVSFIPKNCTLKDCPVICDAQGICNATSLSKAERMEKLLQLYDKGQDKKVRHEWQHLSWQQNQPRNAWREAITSFRKAKRLKQSRHRPVKNRTIIAQ